MTSTPTPTLGAAAIIEESEDLEGNRIATIQTARGDEYVVNLDKLALDFADSFSEARHENRMGWILPDQWFRGAYDRAARNFTSAPLHNPAGGSADE